MQACRPPNEEQRLAALARYNILDTPREPDFDELADLAAEICRAPIAVINLIDRDRQWFKAEVGLGVRETPLDISICAHAILQPGLFVVPDTLEDERFADNPLCTGEPHLRFYAGALLETSEGFPLGTLCVLDYEPRELTDLQSRSLLVLANQVMAQVELRRALSAASLRLEEIDHRVKNSLQLVSSILHMQSRAARTTDARSELAIAADRVAAVASLHDHLHRSSTPNETNIEHFLSRLLDHLKQTAPPGLAVHLETVPLTLELAQMSSLGLLVNELVTNALQHGFAGRDTGNIWVRVMSNGAKATVSVADDGVGVPEDFPAGHDTGLGMRLVTGLVSSLGGRLDVIRGDGETRFAVDFPLQAGAGNGEGA